MLNALNKKLNEFVAQFGEYTTELGEEFEVDLNTNVVYYSFFANVEFEDSFADFILSLDKDVPCIDIFFWSLLHEIGHLETECLNFPYYGKEELAEKYKDKNSIEDLNNHAMEYYALPIEVAATLWAIEWAKDNREYALKFNAELKSDLLDIIYHYYSALDE